jgi:Carboxypeptidase regulatory-like domain/TonB-dependent Receptor Plug Domain
VSREIGRPAPGRRSAAERPHIRSLGGALTTAAGGSEMTRVTVLLVCILAVASSGLAQQGTSELRGRAVDQQGAAMPGVPIVITNQDNGQFRETTSGADGAFLMSGMVPGTYEVRAELAGFKKYQTRDVRLEVGRSTLLEIKLELGTIEESVTVTGEAPLVDTSSKAIGGNVSAREFVDLPSFNRNFTGYLALVPGVVSSVSATTFGADSISVAGQNVRNVNYTMDGSNNNDAFNGGNGGSQARVPVEAVQEFQLLTSQFDAEFGMASGGVVNSVSKQGTNQFRGSAFMFYQDENLTTRDYFAREGDLEKPQTQQQQWGGTLGGPILRNRMHFFSSLERIVLDGGVTTQIPSRPDLERTDFEKTRVWNTFVRADHQINSNHTWGLRWLRETSPQPIQINAENHTPSRYEAETDVDWTLVGNLSSIFGSNKVNTFRVSAVSEDVFFGNPLFNESKNQRDLLPTLNHLNFSDQQSPRASRRLDVAYGADNIFAWFLPNKLGGDHDLKVGVTYMYSSLRNQDFGNMNGTFTFASDLPFDRNNPRTYPERVSIRVGNPLNFLMKGHFIGGFIQDKFRPSERLTLSAGLRYDVEIVRTPNQQNPLFANGAGSSDFPIDGNNFAPRLGFTYALDGQSRSVVRGGFGLFYQRTSYTFLTPMFSAGRLSDSFVVQYPLNNADPGPRAGNFPTQPELAGGPTINHALIDGRFPPGTLNRNVGTVRFDNPDRKNAYSRQYSIGYERQFGAMTGVGIDFIRSEQRAQYVLKDLNPGLRDTTTATSTLRRTNPLVGTPGEFAARVDTLVNEGYVNYNTLQVSLTQRQRAGFSGRASYAFSRGRGNVATGQADTAISQVGGSLNLDNDFGPSNVDRPHIFSLAGSYDVPKTKGLRVSAVFQARSGTPFTLVNTTFDLDRNGLTANEYLPAGTYRGTGQFAYDVDYKGGRNGGRGPSYASLDVRAGYVIRMAGGRTLNLFVDAFNATNEPNFANPTNNGGQADQRIAASFMNLTTLTNGVARTFQLNARLGF